METTHSKTGRTKKPDPKIVVPSWDKIWNSFRETNEIITIEEMNAKGWKTIQQAAKDIGLSEKRVHQIGLEGKLLDREVKKVMISGRAREINFVRPKTTTYQ